MVVTRSDEMEEIIYSNARYCKDNVTNGIIIDANVTQERKLCVEVFISEGNFCYFANFIKKSMRDLDIHDKKKDKKLQNP